jgi:mannose-1-phosphate guanylyltransferase
MAGAEIGDGCVLRGSIVGPGVTVGAGTHVEGLAVLGKDVAIGAENQLMHGIRVFPGVSVPDRAIRF